MLWHDMTHTPQHRLSSFAMTEPCPGPSVGRSAAGRAAAAAPGPCPASAKREPAGAARPALPKLPNPEAHFSSEGAVDSSALLSLLLDAGASASASNFLIAAAVRGRVLLHVPRAAFDLRHGEDTPLRTVLHSSTDWKYRGVALPRWSVS
jgi:hypothetical protein